MTQIKYISIILILILNSCFNSIDYDIEKKFKSVIKTENCEIEYYYPKLKIHNSKIDLSELNELLEQHIDYGVYAHRCDEEQNKKRIIKGDYQILLKTADKLSIEFITEIIRYGGNQLDTVYHSIVVMPQQIGEKIEKYVIFEPEELIPKFDRSNLLEHVKKYNNENQNTINLLAYKTGSTYAITWGLTEKDFILYVGGEGEWYGDDKIRIPITELIN